MMPRAPLDRRRAGVQLHPTSLPGPAAHGRLDRAAYAFADFLAASGFTVWQTLPLAPPDRYGSPYASESAFAGDTGLIDPRQLARDALITGDELERLQSEPQGLTALLPALAGRLDGQGETPLREAARAFQAREAYWLDDYALYHSLRERHQAPWYDWPMPLRRREPAALARAHEELAGAILGCVFGQFLFTRQWTALRAHARERGVQMFGDLPFFVAHDSADVWAHQLRFRLRPDGAMQVETGVPPDYFSATGQLWRMPHYDWDALRATGYRWWLQRLQRQSELFDVLRIDHFRGLAAAWEVPAGASDATGGHWVAGPGLALLERVQAEVPDLALAAEDLGYITEDVNVLRHQAGLPGMRVLQFGFDGDPRNPHLPGRVEENQVYYSGTHDNDTLLGWYRGLDAHTRTLVRGELSAGDGEAGLLAAAHRAVLASPAVLAMLPMQDLLGLGSEARMNIPGQAKGNWRWRLTDLPGAAVADSQREVLAETGRL